MEINKKRIEELLKCIDFKTNTHKFDFMKEKLRVPREDIDEGVEQVAYVCNICGATANYLELDGRNFSSCRKSKENLIFPMSFYFLKNLYLNFKD